MNTLEDIAKMAIEEISTQLANDKEIPTQGPRPLKAADVHEYEQSLANEDSQNEAFAGSKPQNETESLEENLPQSSNQNLPQSLLNTTNIAKNIAQNKSSDNEILKRSEAKGEQKDDLLGERLFLTNLKERAEVLFAGLNTSDENLALRLDLTIRFLEFLLAHTGERLNNLQK